MSRKISQKRLDANRRNAQKSTGPRTPEGKAKASANATTHGLSSPRGNPLAPGTLLHTEDPTAFQALLDEYVITYQQQHRDEYDLLTEAVFAKWRQQRLWVAETQQLEIAIAENEADLQKSFPTANIHAHLANGVAHSERILKLYLRYDAQFRRHYRQCLNDLRDLQDDRQSSRFPPDDLPNEPTPAPPNQPASKSSTNTALTCPNSPAPQRKPPANQVPREKANHPVPELHHPPFHPRARTHRRA